jgi:hypothetical protein
MTHTGSTIREIDDIVCRALPCLCGTFHDSAEERDACLAKPVEVRFKEMFGRALGISEKEL